MYGKIFASMYDGSLTSGKFPWQALVALQQMIVLSDKNGVCDMTIDAMHRKTSLPREIFEIGVPALMLPDPESRTPTFEGRRIIPIDPDRAWGWIVVNKEQYGKIRDNSDRREYFRTAQAERRASVRDEVKSFFDVNLDANGGSNGQQDSVNKNVLTSPDDVKDSVNTAHVLTSSGSMANGQAKDVNTVSTAFSDIDVDRDRDVELQDQKKGALLVLASSKRGLVQPLPDVTGSKTMLAIRERLAAVLTEIQEGARRRVSAEQVRTLQAEFVFAYWAAKMNKPKTIMDEKRERLIIGHLKRNGGDVSELLYAIDGATKDDWIMGRDPKSSRAYDGVETIFRDRAQIERLAGKMKLYVRDEVHPMVVKHMGVAHDANIQPDKTDGG